MKVKTHSEEETKQLGFELGQKLHPGDIVCLYGELGTGKTVFVKGIAKSLGIPEREIASASFIIIAEHEGKIPLYHIDLYRISTEDIYEIGLFDYLSGNGISVIEWAQRVENELSQQVIKIRFFYTADREREIEIQNNITRC